MNLFCVKIKNTWNNQYQEEIIILVGYKNIDKKAKLELRDQLTYQQGQVVSKTLVQNDAVSVTLFAFEKDEEISTHESGGDAMVTVLEGTGRFTIEGDVFILHEGETIIMPAKKPHAVYGEERFKMILTVVFQQIDYE